MIHSSNLAIQDLKYWINENGYNYLHKDLMDMAPREAVMEIAKRAGVRGISDTDEISTTIGLIREMIKLKCRPMK